ncbi:hypothetical protein OG900_37530 [Streptomyces sp. NBC_00433]
MSGHKGRLAGVFSAAGGVAVVLVAFQQDGSGAVLLGILGGLAVMVAVQPVGALVGLAVVVAGGGRVGRVVVGSGPRVGAVVVGRAVVDVRWVPVVVGFRLRRASAGRVGLGFRRFAAVSGPVVAAMVLVLVVPAPYGWAVGVGGGFALLALLFTPGAAPRGYASAA